MNIVGNNNSSGWFRRRCNNWVKRKNKELTSICNRPQNIIESTAWLEVTPVGVDVDVTHWHLNADAQAKGARVGVQDIHKVCVVRGQPLVDVHPFKQGPSRIQTYSRRGSQDGPCQGRWDPVDSWVCKRRMKTSTLWESCTVWWLLYRNAGFLLKTPPDSINWSWGSTDMWIQGATDCRNWSSSRKNLGWLKLSHSSHLLCHWEPSTALILAKVWQNNRTTYIFEREDSVSPNWAICIWTSSSSSVSYESGPGVEWQESAHQKYWASAGFQNSSLLQAQAENPLPATLLYQTNKQHCREPWFSHLKQHKYPWGASYKFRFHCVTMKNSGRTHKSQISCVYVCWERE